jgi:hypothetical protein
MENYTVKFEFPADADDGYTAVRVVVIEDDGREIGDMRTDFRSDMVPKMETDEVPIEVALDPRESMGFMYQEVLNILDEAGISLT